MCYCCYWWYSSSTFSLLDLSCFPIVKNLAIKVWFTESIYLLLIDYVAALTISFWRNCLFLYRYAKHPALLGIELLNEPSSGTVPLDTLLSYYKQGYQIVRKYSPTAYVIVCQRIGNTDPNEIYQANIGSLNLVVDLHYYNLFDTFFVNMSTVDNIQFIHNSRETQLQALNRANGPLLYIG